MNSQESQSRQSTEPEGRVFRFGARAMLALGRNHQRKTPLGAACVLIAGLAIAAQSEPADDSLSKRASGEREVASSRVFVVVDGEGKGIANASVEAEGHKWTGTTDAEGRVMLPGEALREDWRFAVSAAGFVGAHRHSSDFLHDFRGSPTSRGVRLYRGGRLSGRLLGIDGQALPFTPLTLSWFRGSRSSFAWGDIGVVSDEHGVFRVDGIPPGEQVLFYPPLRPNYASISSGGWTSTDGAKACTEPPVHGVCGVVASELEEGEQVKDLVLDLSKSVCSIEGRIFGPDGKPLAGASIYPLEYAYRHTGFRIDDREYPIPQSDADGRYRVRHLCAGEWKVQAYHPRFLEGGRFVDVTLAPGQTVTRDLHVYRRWEFVDEWGRPAEESERENDLQKLNPKEFTVTIGAVGDVATSEYLRFLSLFVHGVNSTIVKLRDVRAFSVFAPLRTVDLEEIGLSETALPQQVAAATHAGELYFDPPGTLVTVNGTIVTPFRAAYETPGGLSTRLIDLLKSMTRPQLVEEVEASRRHNARTDGRRISIKKGDRYLVVRDDHKSFLMQIDGFQEEPNRYPKENGPCVNLRLLYLGHLQIGNISAKSG